MRTVADVMTRDPITVPPDASFKRIVRAMTEHRVSALPVVDEQGRVLGIVSEYDVLQKERFPCSDIGPVFEGSRTRRDRRKADAGSASELMSSPAVTVDPSRSVRDAACVMSERRVKRLAVADPDGRLVGIVARRDLLTVFLHEDAAIREEVTEAVTVDGLDMATTGLVVAVEDGLVSLQGQVARRSTADRIVGLAELVEGVTGVDDELTWELDDVTPDARWPAWPAVG